MGKKSIMKEGKAAVPGTSSKPPAQNKPRDGTPKMMKGGGKGGKKMPGCK